MGAVVAIKQPQLKPKAPSFGEALEKAATTEPKAKGKKATMPTLEATPEVKQAVDEYQEAKAAFKMAEATMNHNGELLMDFVRVAQDAAGFVGRYQGSYAVMGNKHQAKVIYANKYSINSEDEGEMVAILGENFDTLIEKKFSVKLKAAVFEDEALQAELMGLVGERFADFFETEVKLGVCEDFSRLVYQAVQPEQLDTLRTFARQYKPSIR
ncbi:MAG: hypothetical protein QME78_00200 [Thermodesulfobacteriota bacterium]|nr:hypothetical protein [Thermodesulfobacteriota bacterium]